MIAVLVATAILAIIGCGLMIALFIDRRFRQNPIPPPLPPEVREAIDFILRSDWSTPKLWMIANDRGSIRMHHDERSYSPLGWQVSLRGREIPLPSPDVIADMALGLSEDAALLISAASESRDSKLPHSERIRSLLRQTLHVQGE